MKRKGRQFWYRFVFLMSWESQAIRRVESFLNSLISPRGCFRSCCRLLVTVQRVYCLKWLAASTAGSHLFVWISSQPEAPCVPTPASLHSPPTGISFIVHRWHKTRASIFFFFLSFSVSSQCAGSEVKPLTEDRGCDSVLLGQSNRTPHGAVLDEYGTMVEWYLQGKPKYSEKTCPVPLCPPKIPHGLIRARTQASAVRGQRLTAWAMARPPYSSVCIKAVFVCL
jgi:hypothetical protein